MFYLPHSTIIKRVVPKNAFDSFTNTKQKKLFANQILRMTWMNKISTSTTNLPGHDVEEIQVFDIELKQKSSIKELSSIIQRAIPYHLILVIRFESEAYVTTAAKHKNPVNEDNAVIDYVFETPWILLDEFNFTIALKNDLDWVFKHFCEQLSESSKNSRNMSELVAAQKETDKLRREIEKLRTSIAGCKQFNRKVELNLKLKELERRLGEV